MLLSTTSLIGGWVWPSGLTATAVSELLCGSIPMVITSYCLSSDVGETAVGNLTSGSITPLLSHAAAGAGRVRTLLMSQPGGGKGTCEPARSDTLDTVGLQTRDVWGK